MKARLDSGVPTTHSEASLIAKLEGLADAFNRHDTDAVLDFFADHCTMNMPRGTQPCGRRFEGRAAVRAGVAERFKGVPDVRWEGAAHAVVGDLGISRWTVHGTTDSGEPVDADGCDFYFFDADAKVVHKDSYWKLVDTPSTGPTGA